MKMQERKSIVVGVDLSDYSVHVARQAKLLSSALGLPVVYVLVYEDVNHFEGVNPEASRITERLKTKARSRYGLGGNANIQVRFGRAEKEILEVAKSQKSPLIMVGHRSTGRVAHFFLGSVADKLASHSPFPVWIHRGEKPKLPLRILVPSDLTRRTDKALKLLDAFRRDFDAKIEVFHVVGEPFPILDYPTWKLLEKEMLAAAERKMRAFERNRPFVRVGLARGAVAAGIRQRSSEFDLIAVTPARKPKSAFGRVTGRLVRSSDKPVLVVP